MDIDMALLRYSAELVTETGAVYLLDDALLSLAWEEQEGQLAQRATLKLANIRTESGYLMQLVKINCVVRLFASWGSGSRLLFEGIVWEWEYASAQNKEVTVTVYDPMIRLQQSKDFKYFSAGLATPAILENICGDWGVTLDYQWGQQITHEKKIFNSETISDMIIRLLDEVKSQTGSRYIAIYKDGKLHINAYGTNTDVYLFGGNCIISTTDKLTIDNLVTRVKILGKADDDGRSCVDAVIDGKLEFGVLQEIVLRDSDKDIAAASAEAQTLLSERGEPEESIMATAPDLPFLRRGDAVEMAAGNLTGVFYVKGVSHNADRKQMTMTLMRQPPVRQAPKAQESANGSGAASVEASGSAFTKGDAVILNGPVYIDSYGNGKGRTFTAYRSTITITAPSGRPCPYHIGRIGWVYPSEITKA